MKRYELSIKSHIDAPDYETIIFAENFDEAVLRAYEDLRGECELDYIRKNLEEIKDEQNN